MAKGTGKVSKRASRSSGGGVATAEPPPLAARDAGGTNGAPRAGKGGGGGRGGKGGRGRAGRPDRGIGVAPSAVEGKQLVIVESPSKAKTINKYLGPGYVVVASVGHVRDLPEKNPKGDKSPVPGVDLAHDFHPTYAVLADKTRTISELKRAAKAASQVWFATDLDREGEAIAWHLADEMGISPKQAKRVMFAAITKDEIKRAFDNPHPIDMDRVNAQQARRILDRVVGYQVSPLLWKKVARGLSAGRVQSVAVRLVLERERQIRVFVPDEEWSVTGFFTLERAKTTNLAKDWAAFLATKNDKGEPPPAAAQTEWLSDRGVVRAVLVELSGKKFEPALRMDKILGPLPASLTPDIITKRLKAASAAFDKPTTHDLTPEIVAVVEACGLASPKTGLTEKPDARGPARWVRTIAGATDHTATWTVSSVETKRVKVRPPPPFITSTLQQAGSTRLGFGAQRTMRAAQQLYEGVEVPGEGPVGLITYMRTDSTHLSGAALNMARDYIAKTYGPKYFPEKPNFFTSSNKAAQEAHEAIRPTNLNYPPSKLRSALKPDQFRLYELIWNRFVGCQMSGAEWDSTAVLITGSSPQRPVFKASGRVLVFDGFYKVAGVPKGDELNLPSLAEKASLHAFDIDARQRFTSPPARFSEASLIKALEAEGIGRPSTYASIIQVIQDRKYVEQIERRMYATDLGEVVTDKLIEAFPRILDIGYTRQMEGELDKVEEEHLDWIDMLRRFYGPFKEALEEAHETMSHAKAQTTPAPKEYRCSVCQSDLVYRFGKNGRFLSCSNYPNCTYACPIDREGKPRPAEHADVACHKCGGPMIKRTGRFGPFLGCARYNDTKHPQGPCDGILNIDKKGHVTAPSPPALLTDVPCAKCGAELNLRPGIRGPWLGCSKFPKCRGRGKWSDVTDEKRASLEAALDAHERANPIPIIRTLTGKPLTDAKGKPLPDAPTVDRLAQGEAINPGSGAGAVADASRDDVAVDEAA